MTGIMRRDLDRRLAELQADAQAGPDAPDLEAEFAVAEPERGDAEAPPQAVAGLPDASDVPGSGETEASASVPEPSPIKAQAPQRHRTKPKRPHDGVKPPFRGLKRLWRKARGRGVPRR